MDKNMFFTLLKHCIDHDYTFGMRHWDEPVAFLLEETLGLAYHNPLSDRFYLSNWWNAVKPENQCFWYNFFLTILPMSLSSPFPLPLIPSSPSLIHLSPSSLRLPPFPYLCIFPPFPSLNSLFLYLPPPLTLRPTNFTTIHMTFLKTILALTCLVPIWHSE